MKYALYLGCTVPVRTMNYELSARKALTRLGIELVDSDAFTCCGYPLKGADHHAALMMAAQNLIVAQELGLDILTLCTACSGTLTEASKLLNEDAELRTKINAELEAAIGKQYEGQVRVRHIARVLYEDIGVEQIRAQVQVPLTGWRLAAQYGCHYIKPSEIFEGFDSPEVPHTLDELLEATGAEAVDYTTKLECCGGGIMAMDEQVALMMPHTKLQELSDLGVDAMVLVCPFCDIMYEYNQRRIAKLADARYRLPVLFYPQVLGLALGIPAEELGFDLNRVKTRELDTKIKALAD